MADEPEFFTPNRIDDAASIIVTSGDASKGRLFDRDKGLQLVSAGQTPDGVPYEVEVRFQDNGVALSRKISVVVVLNWNGAAGSIERFNGVSFVNVLNFSGQAASFAVFTFAQVDTERIKFIIDDTQIADQEKKMGELLFMDVQLVRATDRNAAGLRQTFNPVATIKEMDDGGIDIDLRRWSGTRTDRYQAMLNWIFESQAEMDAFLAAYRTGEFTLRPEPVQRPDRFFQVTPLTVPFNEDYTDRSVKPVGQSHSMMVRET